jgi:hypothetical protein
MNPLRASYVMAYNVLAGVLRLSVWVGSCPICGKRFMPKTAGLGSPCRLCNQRLLDAQASLEALDFAKPSDRSKGFVSDRGV